MENGLSESFVLGLLATIGGLVTLVFSAMRKSRCSDISCCWGLFKCLRQPLTNDEIRLDPPSPHPNQSPV